MNKNFAVLLPSREFDATGFYKKGLIDAVLNKYPWLKVAGVDEPSFTKQGKYIRGVDYAGPGNLITFGSAKYHDVNWIERPDFARSKGRGPIYDLAKQYDKVMEKLEDFAMSRKPWYYVTKKAKNYGDLEVYDNFIRIGYDVYPRTFANAVKYYTPKQLDTVVKVVVNINI